MPLVPAAAGAFGREHANAGALTTATDTARWRCGCGVGNNSMVKRLPLHASSA